MSNSLPPPARQQIEAAIGTSLSTGFELSYPPFGTAFLMREAADRLDFAYVTLDPMPIASFWGTGEKGQFKRFRSADARAKHLEEQAASGAASFAVDLVDGELTVATEAAGAVAGIYTLPAERSRKLGNGEISNSEALAEVRRILGAYGAWQRGELCGVAVERYWIGKDGVPTLSLLDVETHWLQLSPAGAEARLEEFVGLNAGYGRKP